jgi:predicted ArsR family transcriptional regulator
MPPFYNCDMDKISPMDAPAMLGEGDVLSQPTRGRLFALLEALRRPARTSELAEAVGLHPNGVRVHLERMEQAGLVRRTRGRPRRGRPPDAWTIAPGARPGGQAPHGYRDLGRWLVRALGAAATDVGAIEETGRQIGREIAPHDAEPGLDTFMTSLTTLGFAPSIEHRDGDGVSLCLHNCPYAEAVHENQPVVCALHLGLTRGLLERVQPDAALAGFTPRDPGEAGCAIELRVQGPAA